MNIYNSNYSDFEKDDFDFRKEFFKYLFFWKYFLVTILLSLTIAFIVNRYSDKIYETKVKIKILDKKESSLELPSVEDLFSNSKINLENELELIKSYSILEQVAINQNLTVNVEAIGSVISSFVVDYPFDISSIHSNYSKELLYRLELKNDNLIIIDYQNNDKEYIFKDLSTKEKSHKLPFEIYNLKKDEWLNDGYLIKFLPIKKVVDNLKKNINAASVGKMSDIISLSFNSTNAFYARNVLNELIKVFDEDGIKDRQLIHKRTIDFVNDRYAYLTLELDSIEINKQLFKSKNELVDLKVNSNLSLEKSSKSEENIFSNENQIFIVSSLLKTLDNLNFDLLPSNIGVENKEINSLISLYNQMILEQKKLIVSAGPNHPSVQQIHNSLKENKSNIIFSLQNYLSQLEMFQQKLLVQSNIFNNQISNLPKNEKTLRAIERNQEIKEALYLFLLQKREEAEVSYAVTEPSIKVIEYAISNEKPISPNTNVIYLLGIVFGILIPFVILYIFFLFDDKIHSLEDIESSKYEGDVLGEIPFFEGEINDKLFTNPSDRSIISESFRMLMSNVKYFLGEKKSNVILVTSSIKGEGKTLTTVNLSLSFASLNKKVLLIGCDLRNPQIHNYIGCNKNLPGLVDYLVDSNFAWKSAIINPFEKAQSLDVILSGPLPPNPLSLINNGNLEKLINDAKKIYDYVIIDSAPTLLVADTKNITKSCDLLLTIVRAHYTDIDILNHISKIYKDANTNNAIILNGIGQKSSYGYAYGYKYGYGYNYKYSYNYGYGYGYSSDDEKL